MTSNFDFQTTSMSVHEDILPKPRKSIYSRYVKRLLDILLSSFALIVLSPVFIVVSLLELVFHGRPVMYQSMRPGKECTMFKVFKFRSMTNGTDEKGQLLPEEERITRFGRVLRRLSIDEFPELFSILCGDMSIIGPRPLLPSYVGLYTVRHNMRHSVRPGLACVKVYKKGEERLTTWTWRDQFENDIFYIENISFLLDLRMIFAVAKAALLGSDSRSNDTRVPFNGDNLDDTRTKQEALATQESALKI